MIDTMVKTKPKTVSIARQNELKREEWLKTQEIHYIPVSSIELKYDIHTKAKCDFNKQINKLKDKGVVRLDKPIVVKDEDNGRYTLITGYKGYCIAQALLHTMIPAVIIKMSRYQFLEETGHKGEFGWKSIDDIAIPECFIHAGVREDKVQRCMDYYREHEKMDKPVTVSKRGYCIDGYSRYVACVHLGIDKIFCRFV